MALCWWSRERPQTIGTGLVQGGSRTVGVVAGRGHRRRERQRLGMEVDVVPAGQRAAPVEDHRVEVHGPNLGRIPVAPAIAGWWAHSRDRSADRRLRRRLGQPRHPGGRALGPPDAPLPGSRAPAPSRGRSCCPGSLPCCRSRCPRLEVISEDPLTVRHAYLPGSALPGHVRGARQPRSAGSCGRCTRSTPTRRCATAPATRTCVVRRAPRDARRGWSATCCRCSRRTWPSGGPLCSERMQLPPIATGVIHGDLGPEHIRVVGERGHRSHRLGRQLRLRPGPGSRLDDSGSRRGVRRGSGVGVRAG